MTSQYPRRRDGLTIQEMDGETMIYDDNNEAIHTLNATAQLIWALCDGEHDTAAMAQAIRQKFAIPRNQDVEGDVKKVLAQFAEKGILQSQ